MAVIEALGAAEWDAAKARHLLNRAGFGGTAEQVAKLVDLGPEAAVNVMVDYQSIPCTLADPACVLPPINRQDIKKEYTEMGAEAVKELYDDLQRQERSALTQLKGWWLERMYRTPRPLEEKLALFWHGHFATSSQKIRSSYHTYYINKLFRDHAAGNFKTLTTQVGQSPAMLMYLDNLRSNKQHPNENWARELMELFTLGKGNYTEDDIKNSARAFTGWTVRNDVFEFAERQHDDGEKVFMGRRGNFDGWEIIDIIFEQPACADYIAKELAMYFVNESPDPAFCAALGATLRENKYELKPMLKQMFLAKEFYSPANLGTQIKSPVQFFLQLNNELSIERPPYADIARACAQMGQDLFFPQNVKGWDGNRAWINANALLLRYNYAKDLLDKDGKKSATASAEMSEMGMMAEAPMMQRDDEMLDGLAREFIGQLPAAERDEALAAWTSADESARTAMLAKLAARVDDVPMWSMSTFYAGLSFTNYAQCADALMNRFISVPVAEAQRGVILAALGAGADPAAAVTSDAIPAEKQKAALHLVLSMAEYQLC